MKIVKNIRCMLMIHDYRAVLRNYDYFSTEFTDRGYIRHWYSYFFRCEHCGHRSFYTDMPKYISHPGIEKTKNWWLDSGYISEELKNPNKETPLDKPKTENPMNEKVLKLVAKALSTHSEAEAFQCLQMARRIHKK